MLNVALGKGVKVAVGGNQTIVAVGVSVAGAGVGLAGGGGGVTGRQAVRPARHKVNKPVQNIQRTRLVYYGKIILGI